jgi:hypothetical protein
VDDAGGAGGASTKIANRTVFTPGTARTMAPTLWSSVGVATLPARLTTPPRTSATISRPRKSAALDNAACTRDWSARSEGVAETAAFGAD